MHGCVWVSTGVCAHVWAYACADGYYCKLHENPSTQWEFSSQKGMKIRFLAKAVFELWTPELPQ